MKRANAAAGNGARGIAASSRVQLRSRLVLEEYISLLGYTGRSFAREAGLGHATLNHLLTGRRNSCTRWTAERIETALHCPAGLLFE